MKILKQKYDEKCKELLGYKILEKFNNHKKDKLIKQWDQEKTAIETKIKDLENKTKRLEYEKKTLIDGQKLVYKTII